MRGESECLWCDISVFSHLHTGPLWRSAVGARAQAGWVSRNLSKLCCYRCSAQDCYSRWYCVKGWCRRNTVTVKRGLSSAMLQAVSPNRKICGFCHWMINKPFGFTALWKEACAHGKVGGIVKSWLNGLELVTWTHSCISCHGCEHTLSPQSWPAVSMGRRVLQSQGQVE